MMATCIKCRAAAKHDPIDGVLTTCGRHSKAHAERAAERMRKLNADPEFAKAHAERAAERMRKLNADPEFAKAKAERMRQRHADPEFAKANAERMRKLNADPEFAKANAERMRKRHADPEFNPLAALTEAERADYDVLRKAGYTRAEAFRAIGRVV